MIARKKSRRLTRQMIPALIVASLAGCSLFQASPKLDEPVGLIAVMPIEREGSVSKPGASDGPRVAVGAGAEPSAADAKPSGHEALGNPADSGAQGIAADAARVITAQIYDVMSSSSEWRFVPDLTVSQAFSKADLNGEASLRARWLGHEVGADAVLFGTVSRYIERVGAEYGAKQPAAVAIQLQLISVKTGTILWKDSFDEEQQPLSSNLFNWWQFWKGGAKWFTAQEYAHVAVEHMLDDLAKRME